MENNDTDYWNPDSPGKAFKLSEIKEPILFIEIVLTRFQRLIDAGHRDKYISEERCGCLPPCFDRRLTLGAVREGLEEGESPFNIEVLYDVAVSKKRQTLHDNIYFPLRLDTCIYEYCGLEPFLFYSSVAT